MIAEDELFLIQDEKFKRRFEEELKLDCNLFSKLKSQNETLSQIIREFDSLNN
jgi:hypothetical protein